MWCTLTIGVALLSAWIEYYVAGDRPVGARTVVGMVVFWLSVTAAYHMMVLGGIMFGERMRHSYLGFTRDTNLPAATLFICVPAIVGPGLVVGLLWGWTAQYFQNTGTLFAIISGVLGIVGFYFTFESLLEMRQQIHTFPDLIDRLVKLIKETSPDGRDYVRYMAFTPATGSLAVPPKYWDELRSTLEQYKKKICLICLKKEDHDRWLKTYIGRADNMSVPISAKRVAEVIVEVDRLIESLGDYDEDAHAASNGHHTSQGAAKHGVKRLSENRLPDYYLFANETRAIVITPFFLPMPIGALDNFDPREHHVPGVHVYGFETTDPMVVHLVQLLFGLYLKIQAEPRIYQTGYGSFDEVNQLLKQLMDDVVSSGQGRFVGNGRRIFFRLEMDDVREDEVELLAPSQTK
ncbi:MAG: hypothetical protein AABP62_05310 [Planctomycetota bacterium]